MELFIASRDLFVDDQGEPAASGTLVHRKGDWLTEDDARKFHEAGQRKKHGPTEDRAKRPAEDRQ